MSSDQNRSESPRRSDAELLEAWRTGDRVAGDALISRHFRPVYRLFARKLDEGAEDLTQRTFLTCCEQHQALRQSASFRAFALRVARNLLVDELRRRDATSRRDAKAGSFRTQTSPSKAAAGKQEQRLLLHALRRLPLDLQLTLELHYWEDLTTAEVADVLQVAPGTIKWRLSRARALLLEMIQNGPGTPEVIRSTMDGLDQWAADLRRGGDERPSGESTAQPGTNESHVSSMSETD